MTRIIPRLVGAFTIITLLALPAGALEMEVEGRISSSGEGSGGVTLEGRGWIGLASMLYEEDIMSLGNFGAGIPWGEAGSFELRGILKELESPSLNRKIQEMGEYYPRLIRGRQAGPRKGILISIPDRTWGLMGWGRDESLSLGVWLRCHPARRFTLSLGGITQELPGLTEEEWILEEPRMVSSRRTSLGLQLQLALPSWDASLGLYSSGGRADPPGGWIRGRAVYRGSWAEAALKGSVSSPRAWTPQGKRLKEALYYSLGVTLFPKGAVQGRLSFTETQFHPSLVLYPYRAHEAEGAASLRFSLRSWEAEAGAGRHLRGEETGGLSLKDWYEVSLGRTGPRLTLGMAYGGTREPGGWEHRGEASAGWKGRTWSCSAEGQVDFREEDIGWRAGGRLSFRGRRWRLSGKARLESPPGEREEFLFTLEAGFYPLR